MKPSRSRQGLSLLALALLLAGLNSLVAFGQGPSSDKLNFEVQLHVLIASNESGDKGNVPQALDAVVKQLKPSLPYNNYRVAATFVNRVKNGGTLEVKGVVASDLFTGGITPTPPTFYEFTLFQVKLDGDDASQSAINITKFRFGFRLPITTGMSRAEGSNAAFPVINYEPTGITTELSLREGMPTVVGTMTSSRSDQVLVLVTSVKRTL